ncbi:Hypothetical protein KNT65_gp148 [Escherichia phage EcS1]|uniref:Uncharacterized protein n=1 Tax=Escherichia phage EcS1 TaxID=2083276 RepID=A0A2Z5ZCJ5_9CAUD|nr:Hypothetical protein KNT65_gp148 [Escherichia phage EcS1]BBC78196.1 Hypothetical protein [Escherichia phage EcS1]
MTTFNTVTIDEITDDFGCFENFRAILNTETHEYHVTDLFEAVKMADIVKHVNKNWSFAKVVIGSTI